MKKNKVIALIALTILALAIFTQLISAYELLCLNKGEVVRFSECNPNIKDRTCGSTGGCQYCVSRGTTGAYCPASLNACNHNSLSCSYIENSTIDSEPPTLTFINPHDGQLISTKAFPLIFDLSEESSVYFLDLVNGRGLWSQVCSSCSSYNRVRSFSEGLNKLEFKAKDTNGNTAFYNITFTIDSQKPSIMNLFPSSGFASGDFSLEFEEDNPLSLIIYYGNDLNGIKSQAVNLSFFNSQLQPGTSGFCYISSSGKKTCRVSVNLSSFNEQDIQYWFVLKDIANNTDTADHRTLKVDTKSPALNWFDYITSGKYLSINMSVTDVNFQDIIYYDYLDPKAKWTNICSTSKCNKKISLLDGNHQVEIRARDKAGNFMSRNISFFTDSKKPIITKTDPTSGFTNGDFDVEFIEANPNSIILYYGNDIKGIKTQAINPNTCVLNKDKKDCATSVNLNIYNGQKIRYWFNVTDRVNQSGASSPRSLDVDTLPPVIKNINYTVNSNRVNFNITAIEQNLDKITYFDNADPRASWRVLCTSLVSNSCVTHVFLNGGPGIHPVDIQVTDKAGNAVANNLLITIA